MPNLWHLEISNVLFQAVKKKRIALEDTQRFLMLFSKLPIKTDLETHSHAFTQILELAQVSGLTSYDAAYSEFALRKKLFVASRDKELIKVVKRLQVSIIV